MLKWFIKPIGSALWRNQSWPKKSAESVNRVLKLILRQHQILSITADNGTEFNRLSDVFSREHIYYAHPYASWERGNNENHNRLIRRWLPKGTKKTTPKEVAFIKNWINNYPKKCLDYKSPREDFLLTNLNLKFSIFIQALKEKREAQENFSFKIVLFLIWSASYIYIQLDLQESTHRNAWSDCPNENTNHKQ